MTSAWRNKDYKVSFIVLVSDEEGIKTKWLVFPMSAPRRLLEREREEKERNSEKKGRKRERKKRKIEKKR